MDQQRAAISLPFAKIVPVKPVNNEFTLAKVYVCSPGKNRNMSYLSQEELDAAEPTLAYVPVVGHLIEETDEEGNVTGHHFGGHDYTVTDDLQVKMLTVPFGVVTAEAPAAETVTEFGKEKTYVTAYAILWTGRYPELKDAIYSEDTWFGQSMEMNFKNYTILEEDSNYVELHGLSYSALCILGKSDDPSKHVEPCFPSARIDPVKFDMNAEQFNQLMAEMRQQLSFCFDDASKKGGKANLNQEKINEIFQNAGLQPSEVNFSITEDMTEEQLLAAIEEYKQSQLHAGADGADPTGTSDDTGEEPTDPTPSDDTEEPEQIPADDDKPKKTTAQLFSATMNQKRDALRDALPSVYTYNADGSIKTEICYWVNDFDDTFVYVDRDYWDAEKYECTYGRFPYSFDDATKTASITGDWEEMVRMWLTKAEADKVETDRAELETLRKFKKDAEAAAFSAKIETLLSEFSDLAALPEFAEIREKATEFASIDDLETQLYALRGKQVKMSKKSTPAAFGIKVGIDADTGSDDAEPYGGLFAKYNIKPHK
nr:MAG TPA: hypothetical protein [Caudoviricetes sp.]